MRSKCAVFVDAGYLLSAAATRATGSSLRNGIVVNYPKLIRSLIVESEKLTQLPVLRVNWYDASDNGVPDREQENIGQLRKVKLRLGRFGFDGQQKGVDLRIGLDLVSYARNGAVETLILVSGDDDLTEAVEEAQSHVEVIALTIPDAGGQPHGISRHLWRAVDDVEVLAPELLDAAVRRPTTPATRTATKPAQQPERPVPSPPPATLPPVTQPTAAVAYSSGPAGAVVSPDFATTEEDLALAIEETVSKAWESYVSTATDDEVHLVNANRPSIPRELDRAMLLDLSTALDISTLSDAQRYELRRRFWEIIDRRHTA